MGAGAALRAVGGSQSPRERQRILIGGVPRGGTTLALRLIGDYQGVFAWPGESGVLNTTQALWSNGAPNPACREQIEANVLENLVSALIAMQSWNLASGDMPDAPLPDLSQVQALAHAVTDAAYAAASVRHALVLAADALSAFLSDFTDAAVIAEKTPNNIFAFPHLCDLSSLLWIVCHREPFAVIASMQQRAGADPFAAGWDSSVDGCIGVYLRHAKRVIRALRTGQAVGICYDAMCNKPDRFFSDVAARSGFALGPHAGLGVVRQIAGRQGWRKFDPIQRWRVLRLTESVRRLLGYDEGYYGLEESEMSDPAPLDCFAADALNGLYSVDAGATHRWMAGEASFAIVAPHDVSAITARVFVPAALGLPAQALTVVGSAGRRLAHVAVPPDQLTAITVDLSRAAPLAVSEQGRLFRFDVYAAQNCLPLAQTPGLLDARVVSCLLSAWKPAS